MRLLQDIDVFVTVAAAGGFRAAAERLEMPNSTVSRRIGDMEKSLGVRLFNRTTRRVELTEAGRMYFERCQTLVEEARAAQAELMQEAESPSGLIRASLPVDFAPDRLTAIISRFIAIYPRIRFDLDISPRRIDLLSDRMDFAIRIGRSADSGLIQRKLTDVSVGLFAAPAYLAERAHVQNPSDLTGHSILTVIRGELQLSHSGNGTVFNLAARSPVTMNNVSWLKRFAVTGMGIAVLAPEALRDELSSGQIIRILPEWTMPPVDVHVLTASKLLPSRVRLFLDYLFENIDRPARADHASA